METTIIADVWKDLTSNISFTIVLIVISTGYFVRWVNFLNSLNNAVRIALCSIIPVVLFTFMKNDLDWATCIVSYFVAFGMHAVLIKWFENITGLKNKI